MANKARELICLGQNNRESQLLSVCAPYNGERLITKSRRVRGYIPVVATLCLLALL
jgi:hypothetical protein